MASYTTNLNLKKPAGSENVSIGDINGNMDTIDSAIGKLLYSATPIADYFTPGSSGMSVGGYATRSGNNVTIMIDISGVSVSSGENQIGVFSKFYPTARTVTFQGFVGSGTAYGTGVRCAIDNTGNLKVYSPSSASGTLRLTVSYQTGSAALP